MLDPREVTTIERAIELLEYNGNDKAPIKMLKSLLNDTEEAINDSAPVDIMAIIPRVLNRLKKEFGYGVQSNIPTESVQRDSDRIPANRREWDSDKQTERDEQTTQ